MPQEQQTGSHGAADFQPVSEAADSTPTNRSPVAPCGIPWFLIAWMAAWLVWTGLAAACLYELRSPRLLCLLYHRFASESDYAALAEPNERVYTISAKKFEAQLASLRRLGYRAISLAEAVAFVDGSGSMPDRAVLITIDDGCRNAVSIAEPLLRQHALQATLFMTTDPNAYVFRSSVPGSERLADDDIRRLDRTVWSVGGHGHTHRPLRDLPDADLSEELRINRDTLGRLVTAPPVAMAVPGNWHGPNVRAMAPRVGYTHVFVSDAGFIHPGDNPTALPRLNISGRWSLGAFERNLAGASIARRRVGRALKSAMSVVIGNRTAAVGARWMRSTLPAGGGGFLIGQAAFLAGAMLIRRHRRAGCNAPDAQTCQAVRSS